MPDNYALTILLNDVDVTEFIKYDSLSFDDFANAVSYFRFTIENPSGVTPAQLQSVLVLGKTLDPVPVIFRGLVMEVQTKKRDNGITLEYAIEAADQKVRLQKSVLPDKIYTGVDTDIIDEIFGDVYPDLSDIFEISDGTDSFATDLELPVSDSSLLDAINDLANRSGAKWRMERGNAISPTISFTNVNDGIKEFTGANPKPYWVGSSGTGVVAVSPSDGNPGHCLKWTQSGVSGGLYKGLAFTIFFPAGTENLSPVSMDVWYLGSGNDLEATMFGDVEATVDTADEGTWQTITLPDVTESTWFYDVFLRIPASAAGANEIRIDNVLIGDIQGQVTTRDQLRWGDQPETTDWDLDIANSDEFAFDIDLSTGSIEDVNSVIVIGGKEDVAIDWIYGSFGTQDHFDLEKPVKGIQVYKNTGDDSSIVWTLQDLGIFGTDELTGVGAKDVLYDAKDHWLLFATDPDKLDSAIRITGTIEKPIRALVEGNVGSNPILVTPIYDDTISSTEQAVAIGNATLNRINAAKRLSFVTYNPGLKVGQAIQVIDSARGLNETLVIHTMRTRWLGASGHAEFTVECGDQETISADILIADLDKRTRLKAYGANLTTSTINLVTDVDGSNALDTNNALVYEVS